MNNENNNNNNNKGYNNYESDGRYERFYENNEDIIDHVEGEIVDEKIVKKNSMFKKKNRYILKLTASALVFGLIAGASFQGYNYVASNGYLNNNTSLTNEGKNLSNTSLTNEGSADQSSVITTSTAQSNGVSDVSQVVENVMPSIVSITSKVSVDVSDIFGRTYSDESSGSGSGIIIGVNDNEVLIATNNHVVEGATEVEITFADDTLAKATIKGTDSESDIAVVSVSLKELTDDTKSNIKIAELGDSDELKAGELAIAIGNALGYGQSVTVGYISALNREVKLENGTMVLLQTDAAINPGNSGGALLNANGQVIGINSVKYASSEVEGMGYAIPISDAIPIINELMNREVIAESEKAYLGIVGQDITEIYSQRFNMPIGVYISQISSGSSAEKAGLVVGDIIVKIDNKIIDSMEKLQSILSTYKAGSTADVTLKTVKNGQYEEEIKSITFGKKTE